MTLLLVFGASVRLTTPMRIPVFTRRAGLASTLAGAAVLAVAVTAGPAAADEGTAGLDPILATAYTQAANTAHAQGGSLWITSGKRSVAEQRQMWRAAIAQYGSPAAARKWVLPPEESTHVTGDAIDVGPHDGAAWLQRNGYRWGLCRTFANEWWHFEVATIPGTACPAVWPDAAVRADSRR